MLEFHHSTGDISSATEPDSDLCLSVFRRARTKEDMEDHCGGFFTGSLSSSDGVSSTDSGSGESDFSVKPIAELVSRLLEIGNEYEALVQQLLSLELDLGSLHANAQLMATTADTLNGVESIGLPAQQPTVMTTLGSMESLREYQVAATLDALHHIRSTREEVLSYMLQPIRHRAMQLSVPVSKHPPLEPSNPFSFLLGRCFNLSINMKILSQCKFGDCNIAARVFSDLNILQDQMDEFLAVCRSQSVFEDLAKKKLERDAERSARQDSSQRKHSPVKPVGKLLKLPSMKTLAI